MNVPKAQFKDLYESDFIYDLSPVIDGKIYAKVKTGCQNALGKTVNCDV